MQNFISLKLIKQVNSIFINILNEYKVIIINVTKVYTKIK